FTSPIPTMASTFLSFALGNLSERIAPDDRRMAVPILTGSITPRRVDFQVKYVVWQFDKSGNRPIAGEWVPVPFFNTTYFDADGIRLLIGGAKKIGTGRIDLLRPGPDDMRQVIELWDLTASKRLMSTADGAPELTVAGKHTMDGSLSVAPQQGA